MDRDQREQTEQGDPLFDRPLPRYAAHFVPDAHFVTCRTRGRDMALNSTPGLNALRTVLGQIKTRRPFYGMAYVLLPDHLHLCIKPAAGVTLDQIVRTLARAFDRAHQELHGQPQRIAVLQTSYTRRKLHTLADFALALDTIHYDPVHHGAAARPEEWPHSSYADWTERGLYKLGWGWQCPARLRKTDWG